LLDRAGNPSTDPASYYDGGALLPFGAHKGSGLALAVQIMANIMTGFESGSTGERRPGNPTLITAWSPDTFVAGEVFGAAVEKLLTRVKRCPPAPGFDEVLLPGEPEARAQAQRTESGIPVPEPTWQALVSLAQDLGVWPVNGK
jgi:hydroxycarboxylate dehydrogenase B